MASIIDIRSAYRHVEDGVIDNLSDMEILNALEIVGECDDFYEFLLCVADNGIKGGRKFLSDYEQLRANEFNMHLQEYVDAMFSIRTMDMTYPPF